LTLLSRFRDKLTISITYLNTASFVVYLIPSWFKYRKPQSPTYQAIVTSPSADTLVVSPPPSSPRSNAAAPADNERISLNRRTASVVKTLPKLSVVETAKVAGWWAFFWFLANWALNVSLAWTSVASVTILSSTSGESRLSRSPVCSCSFQASFAWL